MRWCHVYLENASHAALSAGVTRTLAFNANAGQWDIQEGTCVFDRTGPHTNSESSTLNNSFPIWPSHI